MDGLSILLGVLIFVFFIVVFGMNFLNSTTNKGSKGHKEGFTDAGSTEAEVRATLDSLAFYISPDGTKFGSGTTDGEQLCTLFTLVRETLAKNEAAGQKLDDAEISKRVEATLESKIPGGALPCPLVKYPSSNSTDLEWLSFVQSIPQDFGARVVLMARYADTEITSVATQLQSALSGNVPIPTLPPITPPSPSTTQEPFINVCPPRIASKKRDDNEEASCTLPENLTPEQISPAITSVLRVLVDTKNSILVSNSIDPKSPIHEHIKNATKSANYLKAQQKAIQSGTLTMTGPVTALS